MSLPPERSRTPQRRGRSPPRRPRNREVVVERLVPTAGPTNYPMLTKTNYNEWSLLMKIKLEARCLCNAVDPGDVEFHVDRMALDAICSAVPPEMVASIATKPSARAAWNAIRTMRVGDDRVRKSSAQRVRRQYEELTFKDGEGVEDFALRLTGLVNQLAILGDPEDPAKVVEKYLRIARSRYKQLVISMETLLDISALSVEEVTGRLLASEDSSGPAPSPTDGKLFLTEEQWLQRYKLKEGESGRSSGGNRGRGRRRGGRGRGHNGGNRNPRETSGGSSSRNGDECHNCGKSGHWARECPSRKKEQARQGGQVHVAQDDEPSLLLIHGSSINTMLEPASSSVSTPGHWAEATPYTTCVLSGSSSDEVQLQEKSVHAVLDGDSDRDPYRWIFDTGATNHMTGCWEVFSDLDTGVTGTVKFGDDSVAQIEGCGTVLFNCKNGEHHALFNTYFIPRLTANIISCGQLDEVDCEILIKRGMMRVRDQQHRLLAKIHRGPGRLYVLDIVVARPVCLATRAEEDAWCWHSRFGHTNFAALRKMARDGLIRGLPALTQVEQLCDACIAGKHRRAPFPTQVQGRSEHPLDLLHGDICGPITPATPSGNRYFLLLVDDFSRFMWVVLLGSKDLASTAIKRVQAAAERKCGRKLLALRTDRGGSLRRATSMSTAPSSASNVS